LPAWYHLSAKARPLTNAATKCLLRTHNASTIADLMKISARLRGDRQITHRTPDPNCACIDCIEDRINKCRDPHRCATEAQTRIQETAPKLNPLSLSNPHDNLSLTKRRKDQNISAREENGEILFDPTITCKNNLAECFRIFTDPTKISPYPATRRYTVGITHSHPRVTIYTDGACFKNGKEDARCGSGVWIGPDNRRNTAIQIPGENQSNQVGEIAAIIKAVNTVPTFWPILIKSD
ncbi:hypothetical protein EDB83DRAFT_2172479, partial [Lactarius deliciosus]